MKKLLFKLINKYFLNFLGFEISRRNDTSVTQLKSLFKKRDSLRIIDSGAYKGRFSEEFQIIYPNTSSYALSQTQNVFNIK